MKAVRTTLDAAGRSSVAIRAELGCASPWIVVPGAWSDVELERAAAILAVAKKTCAGSNCLAAQVVLLPTEWPHKETFLAYLKKELGARADVPNYYPGAPERVAKMCAAYRAHGDARCEVMFAPPMHAPQENDIVDRSPLPPAPFDPVALLHCGTPGASGFEPLAITTEAFGPALAVVELPGGAEDATEYMSRTAVPFANEQVMGTLVGALLSPGSFTALDTVLGSLHYGSIVLNCQSHLGYSVMCKGGVWGAHSSDTEMRSGTGYLGNSYKLPGLVKAVTVGPPLATAKPEPSALPPPLVFDALHAAIVRSKGGAGAFGRVMRLLFVRAVQSPIRMLYCTDATTPRFGACV